MNETTSDETIYCNLGNGFIAVGENPHPQYKVWVTMPCGHQGLLLNDRFVCQTCWGYSLR